MDDGRRPERPGLQGASDPEARLLRYFLAVAEELNFTRAAQRLGIAQPALSAQIRQLERRLKTQLLDRNTHAVALTEAGRALQSHGPAALAALEQAWDAPRRVARGEAGRLRLAYSPSTAYETVPRLIGAIAERLPAVGVETAVMTTPDVVDAVRQRRADAGVGRMPAAADGVRCRVVRRQRQGVLMRADHPLAALQAISLDVLARYPVTIHAPAANPRHHDFVRHLFQAAGLQPRLSESPIAFDPTHQAIRDGRVVGIVADLHPGQGADGLRWVPLDTPAAVVDTALVVRDGAVPPLVARFEGVVTAAAVAAGWLRPARR